MSLKFSATVICFNEEDKIEKCLLSLEGVVDEIVVVDSFSTDKTESIVKKLAERLPIHWIQNPFEGHIQQKNFALDRATGDYILSLDADEALSPELKASILEVKENLASKNVSNCEGYSFNRLTNYNGFWVRHCGWYPDKKLRLIKKGSARWTGVNPHDFLSMLDKGQRTQHISGDLLHYSYDSIADHISQTNKFTTIAAKASYAKGTRSSLFKIISRPILKFFRDYIIKAGFLDGRYGLIICAINGLSAFLKYSKIDELQKGKRID